MTRTRKILVALLGLIAVLLIFKAGMLVGYHRAAFSYHFGDNYYRAFGDRDDFPNAHGAVGRIIKVSLPTFVLIGPDNIEKTVLVKADTLIRHFRESASSTELQVDDNVVVLGRPNSESQIEAKFIRLLPPPPTATSTIR